MKLSHALLIFCLVLPVTLRAQSNNGVNNPYPDDTASTVPAGETGTGSINEKPQACVEEVESPFSLYRDTYLLLGYSNSILNKDLIFKFQLSAKFRMPIPGIYLAYTQRSYMDTLEHSAPFTDHNFEPEFYYIRSFSNGFVERNWLRSVQIGYRHGSNGLGGASSRSWERIYLETEFKHKGLLIQPTIWFPFVKDPQNMNVESYYGYGELLIAYAWQNDIRISGLVHAGTNWPKGNVKADLTLPFNLFFSTLARGWKQSNLWFQVFHGYGETFLGFQENTTAVALGVGFRPDFDK